MHSKKTRGNGYKSQVMEIHVIYKGTLFGFFASYMAVAQRDDERSPSPWRIKIQLDRCQTNLIQLWTGGWNEDLQRSLEN